MTRSMALGAVLLASGLWCLAVSQQHPRAYGDPVTCYTKPKVVKCPLGEYGDGKLIETIAKDCRDREVTSCDGKYVLIVNSAPFACEGTESRTVCVPDVNYIAIPAIPPIIIDLPTMYNCYIKQTCQVLTDVVPIQCFPKGDPERQDRPGRKQYYCTS